MKKVIAFLALLGAMQIASASDCGPRNRVNVQSATGWTDSRIRQLEGKSFKGSSYASRQKCTANRELRFSTASGDRLAGHYKMICGGAAWADAEVEVKASLTHYTDDNTYGSSLDYDMVYIAGWSGVGDQKDKNVSGQLCFLPAGRIEFEGNVYAPAQ
ncbi:hypothetical protein [Pandoraea pnomenusa]|nr:hypothetical protein [Pandoraea pnomenusa]